MSIMFVQTPFRKSMECETRMRVLVHFLRYSSSHTQASRSRCAVGSSRRSREGLTKSAFANATRILHPPDMSFVFLLIVFLLKPRPVRIREARVWNVDGSMLSIRFGQVSTSNEEISLKTNLVQI